MHSYFCLTSQLFILRDLKAITVAKNVHNNDLYCVRWDVRPYSLVHLYNRIITKAR